MHIHKNGLLPTKFFAFQPWKYASLIMDLEHCMWPIGYYHPDRLNDTDDRKFLDFILKDLHTNKYLLSFTTLSVRLLSTLLNASQWPNSHQPTIHTIHFPFPSDIFYASNLSVEGNSFTVSQLQLQSEVIDTLSEVVLDQLFSCVSIACPSITLYF